LIPSVLKRWVAGLVTTVLAALRDAIPLHWRLRIPRQYADLARMIATSAQKQERWAAGSVTPASVRSHPQQREGAARDTNGRIGGPLGVVVPVGDQQGVGERLGAVLTELIAAGEPDAVLVLVGGVPADFAHLRHPIEHVHGFESNVWRSLWADWDSYVENSLKDVAVAHGLRAITMAWTVDTTDKADRTVFQALVRAAP
jgi:hypothetical protein